MNPGELTLSAGMLSALFLELVKFILRKLVLKDMSYDFPLWFYGVSIPVLNAVMPFVLVWLGVPSTDPILTMSVMGVVKYLVLTALAAAISVLTNSGAIKPVKNYARSLSR